MFGIVLVIVVITVAVAAMKDAHLVDAISNTKPDVTVQIPMIVDFGEGRGWVRAGCGDDSESQPVNS
jgi:hypothetical protein